MFVSCKSTLFQLDDPLQCQHLTATNQYWIHLVREVEDSRKSARWRSRTPEAVNPMTPEEQTETTWR